MRRSSVVGAGVVASVLASALEAHDTWLLPARFAVRPGATVALDLTSAMRFPTPETPVRPDRLAATGARLAGHTRLLDAGRGGRKALRLSAALGESGVAALWIETRPRSLSLSPEEVEHYLEEIGAEVAVRARWQAGGRRWRESYAKLAKTYVRVGSPASDRSWEEPVGLALEIVPGKDPTSLEAGEEFPLIVLRRGQPLPGFAVSAVAASMSKPVMQRTGNDGRVAFKLDRAGAWLIKGTLLEESTAADTDWESLFTTLTVSVRRRR